MNDYIQYDIVPPAELRPEFDRIMKQQIASAQAQKHSNWENVARYYQELKNWWDADKKYEKPKPVKQPKAPKPVANYQPQNVNFNNVNPNWVRGVVYDNSEPLPGATVFIKGTNTGVQTDIDGKYAIAARVGEVLEFQYVGMNAIRITVGNNKRIDARLTESNVQLDEVVVTSAMGVRRDKR